MYQRNWHRTLAFPVAVFMLLSVCTSCRNKTTTSPLTSSLAETAQSSASEETNSAANAASSYSLITNLAGSKTQNKAGSAKVPAPVYNGKSVFNKTAASKESKISINNTHIVAPPVKKGSAGDSIIKRTQIEGVDGTFYDANIKESVRNLNGKVINFGVWYPDWYSTTGNSDAKRNYDALRAIEKDYNCTIKVKNMQASTNISIANAKASGKILYNVMDIQDSMADSILKTSGLGADLTKVNSIAVKTNQWNPVLTLLSSYKGKVTGVGVRYDRTEEELLFFNKALVSKYNLGDLYDIANKGKWTSDTFLQVSEQYKKVAGNNGYALETLFPHVILNLVCTNWTSAFGITENKYIFNGTDSTVLNMLSFCQTYVGKGLFDTHYSKGDMQGDGSFSDETGTDYQYAITKFCGGQSLFYLGSNGTAVLPYVSANCKDDYGILPLPKGPSADGYTTNIWNGNYYSMIDGDPDIENDGAILTAIANRTNVKTADITKNNTLYIRDKQSLDNLTNNYKYKQILCNLPGNLNTIFNTAGFQCAVLQQSSPKQAMESIQNKAQAAVNQFFGQS